MTFDDDPKREQHGEDGEAADTEPTANDDQQPDEADVDEQLEDTFPASDPPANY